MKKQVVHAFRIFYSVAREKVKAVRRNRSWSSVRESHLKLHGKCCACGGTKMLQVHHIVPVSVDPSKELDSTNLITLCMGPSECHLEIGHRGSWRRDNPNVIADAANFLAERQLIENVKKT
jgi:5-methylcytosine-specific restriction endonuclease McrA